MNNFDLVRIQESLLFSCFFYWLAKYQSCWIASCKYAKLLGTISKYPKLQLRLYMKLQMKEIQ